MMMASASQKHHPSIPIKTMVLCLTAGVKGPSSFSLAFSPPRHPTAYATYDVPFPRSSSLIRDRASVTTRLSALRSSDTQQQNSSNEPFFMQDLQEGGNQNDAEYYASQNSSNGNNSGGMDAYAQQMQDFTAVTSSSSSSSSSVEQQRIESPNPPPYPPGQQQEQWEQGNKPASSTTSSSVEENQPISSVDARVLESILSEGKLDLSTEAEVKKLLEGPRLQEGEDYPIPGKEEGDSKYSSKFVSVRILFVLLILEIMKDHLKKYRREIFCNRFAI